MAAINYIRLILGIIFIIAGAVIFVIQMYGVFHMKYVLNRMHAAAIGDTLGISCSLIGLMLFSGLNFDTLKMAMITLFLWFSSPVSSHMIAEMEYRVNQPENEGITYKSMTLEEAEKELKEKEDK